MVSTRIAPTSTPHACASRRTSRRSASRSWLSSDPSIVMVDTNGPDGRTRLLALGLARLLGVRCDVRPPLFLNFADSVVKLAHQRSRFRRLGRPLNDDVMPTPLFNARDSEICHCICPSLNFAFFSQLN